MTNAYNQKSVLPCCTRDYQESFQDAIGFGKTIGNQWWTRIVGDFIKVKENYKSSQQNIFFDVGFITFWFNDWQFLIGNYQSD